MPRDSHGVNNRTSHPAALAPYAVCERARLARDARFDGLFFTAVSSTGIYCRPVCPAPPPLPRHVRYFASSVAAAAAGYRPCRRCRPELSPTAWHRLTSGLVQQGLALIEAGFLQDHGVAALAERLGVSPRHLQRLFTQSVGAAPHAVHANARLLLAQQLLHETALPLAAVAEAAGYGSLRRFNADFCATCGQPPSAVRRSKGAQAAERPNARRGGRGAAAVNLNSSGDAPATPSGSNALTLKLAYRPPADVAAQLASLARRATPGLEQVDAHSYQRWLTPADGAERPALLQVRAHPNEAALLLTLSDVPPRLIATCIARVRRLFDVDADPAAIDATLAADPVLAPWVAARPGLRLPGAWDGFEVAVRAVLGQQVSMAATATLVARTMAQYGRPIALPSGSTVNAFPTPHQLADAPLESLGLPRARAAALRGLAQAVADGRLHFGAGQALDAFIAQATALPGIGPWTAHYIALRGLAHPDAFPASDLVLRKRLGERLGLPTATTPAQTERLAERWRPWRGYALIHAWYAGAAPV